MLLTRADECLQKASTVDEIQDLRDKAQAARAYAKKAKLGASIVVAASALKIQAERKLGELLQQLPLAKGGQGNQHSKADPNRLQHANGSVTLSDLGVTPWDSSRSQKIASLPKEKFDEYLRDSVESEREPSTSALLRLAKQHDAIERTKSQGKKTGVVKDLRHLVRRDAKFGCIYADPPWPYRNRTSRGASENHYPSMTMEQILAEPVSKLAHEKSHLHLWCSVSFLKEALDVMEAWGFVYKSQFVWVKPQMGAGNYFRISHELLLYGERPQEVRPRPSATVGPTRRRALSLQLREELGGISTRSTQRKAGRSARHGERSFTRPVPRNVREDKTQRMDRIRQPS